MMRTAIMQPYFFPYIGYFQLIHAVDTFVFLDDVAFIKKGWINRNKLSLNGKETWFTVPLQNQSQNKTIRETAICRQEFKRWRIKFLRSLEHFYGQAPFYKLGTALVEEVLSDAMADIASLAKASIHQCCAMLGIRTKLVATAAAFPHNGLKKEARLADICIQTGAREYVNPCGGSGLYTREQFAGYGLSLRFLRSDCISYQAGSMEHGLGFSILDAIMWCGPELVGNDFIYRYELAEV